MNRSCGSLGDSGVGCISDGRDVRLCGSGRAPGRGIIGEVSRGRFVPPAERGAGIRGPLELDGAVGCVTENKLTEPTALAGRGLAGTASLLAAIGSNLPDACVRATLALWASALAFPNIPLEAWAVADGCSITISSRSKKREGDIRRACPALTITIPP